MSTLLKGPCIGQEDGETTTVSVITTTPAVVEQTTNAITEAVTTTVITDQETTISNTEEDTTVTLVTLPPLPPYWPGPNNSDMPTGTGFTAYSINIDDEEPILRSIVPHRARVDLKPLPIGVLRNPDGTSARKRCRCIEKKQRKVLKEIRYIPLAPVIQLDGQKRNFTCKCSHLRKIAKGSLITGA